MPTAPRRRAASANSLRPAERSFPDSPRSSNMSRHCHPRSLRTPLQPARALQLVLAAASTPACTDSAPADDIPATTDDSGDDSSSGTTGASMDAHSFSEDEVRTILVWLAPLPETPHADLS